jgi:hypothetical protein
MAASRSDRDKFPRRYETQQSAIINRQSAIPLHPFFRDCWRSADLQVGT